jgi:hypothetical protein
MIDENPDLVDASAPHDGPPLRRRTLECYGEKARCCPQAQEARGNIRENLMSTEGRKLSGEHEDRGFGKEQGRNVEELSGIDALSVVSSQA